VDDRREKRKEGEVQQMREEMTEVQRREVVDSCCTGGCNERPAKG
jgi:hypothetical protein